MTGWSKKTLEVLALDRSMLPVEALALDRVRRGAAVLDEDAPGWAQKVDLDMLDLSAPCSCVVGQIFARAGRRHTSKVFTSSVSLMFSRRHTKGLEA